MNWFRNSEPAVEMDYTRQISRTIRMPGGVSITETITEELKVRGADNQCLEGIQKFRQLDKEKLPPLPQRRHLKDLSSYDEEFREKRLELRDQPWKRLESDRPWKRLES